MLFHENGSSDVPHVILNESLVPALLILLTFVRVIEQTNLFTDALRKSP